MTLETPTFDGEARTLTYPAHLLGDTSADSLSSYEPTVTDPGSVPVTFGLAGLFIDGASLDTVSLRVVNKSDSDSPRIVIFQKPVPDPTSETIAWTVVDELPRGTYHAFDYCPTVDVSATDAWATS